MWPQQVRIGFERFDEERVEMFNTLAQSLPYALFSLALAVGTCVMAGLIVFFSDLLIVNQKRRRSNYPRKLKAYLRLFIIFLVVVIILVGFTCAAMVVGVNFWNIILGYGILALIIGYMFVDVLQSFGAYIAIRWCNKMEEGQFIISSSIPQIPPTGAELLSLNLLYAEFASNEKYTTQVPVILLLRSPIDVYETNPSPPPSAAKTGFVLDPNKLNPSSGLSRRTNRPESLLPGGGSSREV